MADVHLKAGECAHLRSGDTLLIDHVSHPVLRRDRLACWLSNKILRTIGSRHYVQRRDAVYRAGLQR